MQIRRRSTAYVPPAASVCNCTCMHLHLYALAPMYISALALQYSLVVLLLAEVLSLLFTITTTDMRRTLHAWLLVATVKSFDDALTFRSCRSELPRNFQQLNLSQTAVDSFLLNALVSLGCAGTFVNHRKTVACCVVHFACDVMCRDVPSSLFCISGCPVPSLLFFPPTSSNRRS